MIESFWLIIIATVTLTNFILLSLASLMYIRNEADGSDAFMERVDIRR